MDYLKKAKDIEKMERKISEDYGRIQAYASLAIAEGNHQVLLKTVGRLISEDMHNSSMRPCSTCRTISSIVGEPVGCYHYQKIRNAQTVAKLKKED